MNTSIIEQRRLPSPTQTPQALAWHTGMLWMSSRDLRRIYEIDPQSWTVRQEIDPPGIPWAAVSAGDHLWFTLGEGADDDRYVWRFTPGSGFDRSSRFACPDFTGSYLSYDGGHLYLSQWYKRRILQLDEHGEILRSIDVGGEICGHTFVDGLIYVLRGEESPNEEWSIARLDPSQDTPEVTDLARVPFASRSLTHDGEKFWSNHRAGNETMAFTLLD
jgi:hypothetical protein